MSPSVQAAETGQERHMQSISNFTRWLDTLTSERQLEDRVDEALTELRLAQDLVTLRTKRGFTQAELAHRLGVSQPAIAKIESGRAANLQLKTLLRIATTLGGEVVLKLREKASTPAADSARRKLVGARRRRPASAAR
jgi:transcriptional regulator with XRE-family HTH domain